MNLISYLIIGLLSIYSVNGFNFLNELFNDLKFGSVNHEYLKQKFDSTKLKCLQGSYSYNGSCYFVSNKRSFLRPDEDSDLFLKSLMRYSKTAPSQLRNVNNLGMVIDMASIPTEATWISALNYCHQINNESLLLSIDNNEREFQYIVDLLFETNFPNSPQVQAVAAKRSGRIFNQEQKYFIGLTYNNSLWKWLNGVVLSDEMLNKFKLNNVKEDAYRKCSYVNLRDNGEVNIELTNCNNEKQPYICKYVVDRCYNNTSCGDNGECVNIPFKKKFECRCRIFYEGEKCEKWSNQGIQMIITVVLVIFALSCVVVVKIANRIKLRFKKRKQKMIKDEEFNRTYYSLRGSSLNNDTTMESLLQKRHQSARYSVLTLETNIRKLLRKNLRIILLVAASFTTALLVILTITFVRTAIIEARIKRFIQKSHSNSVQIEDIDKNSTSSRLTTIFSFDFCKIMNDQFLEDYFIVYVSLSLTLFIYFWNVFKANVRHKAWCRYGRRKPRNESNSHVDKMSSIHEDETSRSSSSRDEEASTNCFFRFCHSLRNFVSRCCQLVHVNRATFLACCGRRCACAVEFPVPINPFSKQNRFISSVIYAAYTYNILKIFEYLLVGGDQTTRVSHIPKSVIKNLTELASSNQSMSEYLNNLQENVDVLKSAQNGILIELLKQICNVFIIGFRYYPVLLCIELKRKSKICYFLCTIYVMFQLVYYVYMNMFCLLSAYGTIKNAYETIDNSQKSSFLSSLGSRLNSTYVQARNTIVNETKIDQRIKVNIETNFSLGKEKTYFSSNFTPDLELINKTSFFNNFMYEKFVFYAVLFLISFYMICEFVKLIAKNIRDYFARRKKKHNCTHCQKKLKRQEAEIRSSSRNSLNDDDDESDLVDEEFSIGKVNHEIKYTRELLRAPKFRKPISFSKYLFEKYVYKNRRDFRYTKQFINTNIIAFILLYYMTSLIIRKSSQILTMSSNLLVVAINFLVRSSGQSESSSFFLASKNNLNKFLSALFDSLGTYIVVAACFTTCVYVLQMFVGIKNYHRHVLNAYRGVYVDIPSPKKFSNAKLAASSLHYSGYAIGYLLWGYLILFEVSLVLIIVIRFLIKFYFIAENIAKIVLPILTIYLFKKILIWYLCRFFLVNTRSTKKTFSMKNPKLYFILNHFNFFFDCFLGSFVCFMRMAKSSAAALFFMPRLDYSIFGRYLERTDMGFISYVTFIHMEVNQTHPVKIAFCELAKQSLKKRGNRARVRWALAYTLINNSSLKRQRKRFLNLQKLVPRVESFEKFIERQVRIIFFKNEDKRKSNSTPCLYDEKIYSDDNNDNTNNKGVKSPGGVNVPPRVVPRKNRKVNVVHYGERESAIIIAAAQADYYENLDTSHCSE